MSTERETAKSLRARWQTEAGQEQLREVIQAIRSRQPLSSLGFIGESEGRADLRGIAFPKPKTVGAFEFGKYEFERITDRLEIKRGQLSDADLSFADVSDVSWTDSWLTNVRCERANWKAGGFWGCEIKDCELIHCDLRELVMCGRSYKWGTIFTRVHFDRCDFRNSNHIDSEIYQNCSFLNCNLHQVEFDGSAFSECRFEGTLQETIFRARTRIKSERPLPWQTRDGDIYRSTFSDVDFSKAVLRVVEFDDIDLSNCVFPDDGEHLVVRSARQVLETARKTIREGWEGEKGREIAHWIGYSYLGERIHPTVDYVEPAIRQPVEVINRRDLCENFGEEYGSLLFRLIGSIDAPPPTDEAHPSPPEPSTVKSVGRRFMDRMRRSRPPR